ncbi:MAG: Carbonic anhydrase, gamma class [uncultured Sphingomonadaceae bacterium]|uniref:Carbonic anhydrase, gamma class n=1 Tax=uncultured Sphingomonadaceae bacterium TaxID=169976 RepID=A0A6J4SGE5_9SPHN|nr:MAG: Carbonic anhydrase, gamma class [uncultured Sphingomonadaceae bacterium]
MISPQATLAVFAGRAPRIHPTAFVAPGARLIGDVVVGEGASIWYNCVIRGDVNRVEIGPRSNIQDGTVIHCDAPRPDGMPGGRPTLIGADVLVGHMAMLHGCTLRDRAFVGLGAIVMDDCEVEGGGMLAAGAMLTPGKRVAGGQLWAGRPAKHLRDLSEAELAGHRLGVAHYVENAKAHAAALLAIDA